MVGFERIFVVGDDKTLIGRQRRVFAASDLVPFAACADVDFVLGGIALFKRCSSIGFFNRFIKAPGLLALKRLKLTQECNQVFLLVCGQFGFEHEVEKLHRIVERQQAAIVQVGRRVLNAAQAEGLDRAV